MAFAPPFTTSAGVTRRYRSGMGLDLAVDAIGWSPSRVGFHGGGSAVTHEDDRRAPEYDISPGVAAIGTSPPVCGTRQHIKVIGMDRFTMALVGGVIGLVLAGLVAAAILRGHTAQP